MLIKQYTVTVQDKDGKTLQVFGNDKAPKKDNIENCIKSCKGGLFGFVDEIYLIAPDEEMTSGV